MLWAGGARGARFSVRLDKFLHRGKYAITAEHYIFSINVMAPSYHMLVVVLTAIVSFQRNINFVLVGTRHTRSFSIVCAHYSVSLAVVALESASSIHNTTMGPIVCSGRRISRC